MQVLTPVNYTTHKIKDALCLDEHHLCQLMSVSSEEEFNNFKSNFSKAPPWAIHSLAARLGITMENMVTGHIDYEALIQHFQGNLSYLPKKYQNYKESRFRTISNLLDNLDPLCRSTILNKLQLNETHFKNLENKVCGLALLDVETEIRKLGLPLKKIEYFGYLSSQKYKSVLTKHITQENMSIKKLFDDVMDNVNDALERNLHYEITEKSHSSILMTVSTRPELQDTLKLKNFGSIEHCYNISGWASGILQYQKNLPGKVTKLSCVHQGDPNCKYEIDYAHAH